MGSADPLMMTTVSYLPSFALSGLMTTSHNLRPPPSDLSSETDIETYMSCVLAMPAIRSDNPLPTTRLLSPTTLITSLFFDGCEETLIIHH